MSETKMGKTKKNKGFSIVEIVVATGIASMVFMAMLTLFAHNLRMEIFNRNRIVASYLAQEGIEIVKQTRDNNWFSSSDSSAWLNGIPSGSGLTLCLKNKSNLTGGWKISSLSTTAAKKIYGYNGTYVQADSSAAGWTETGFTRTLDISLQDTDKLKVTVRVGYNGGTGSVAVTSYLYNGWFK